jgi:two-component system chemotaxis response regulator CheB
VASTGGPAALVEIFQALPADYPIPLVVVQHINAEFQRSLVRWIESVTELPVRLAEAGKRPQPGITIAPSDKHLVFTSKREFALQATPAHAHMPSGDVLLSSMAEAYGDAAAGIVLTGMGADGAAGLLDLYQCGALTIAQNEKTSAVYGMPAEAKRLGAVRFELGIGMIAPMLRDITEKEKS